MRRLEVKKAGAHCAQSFAFDIDRGDSVGYWAHICNDAFTPGNDVRWGENIDAVHEGEERRTGWWW